MDRERVKDYAIKSSLESTVQEVLDLLEADDGKPFEEKKAAAVNLLRKSKEAPLAEALVDFAVADTVGKTTKEKFWDAGTISCLNGGLILRKVEEADRDGYIGLQKAYNLMKSMLKEETYCDMVWREHQEPKALMFSIIKDGQYIGYWKCQEMCSREMHMAAANDRWCGAKRPQCGAKRSVMQRELQ